MSTLINPDGTPVEFKSTGVAYLFWLFLGIVGAHQYYLGKTGRGLLYTFTLGLIGVGVLIDLFTLPGQTRTRNAQIAAEARQRAGLPAPHQLP